jgi:hypothetical protein
MATDTSFPRQEIAITGYFSRDRDHAKHMITRIGAAYSGALRPRTTHLIPAACVCNAAIPASHSFLPSGNSVTARYRPLLTASYLGSAQQRGAEVYEGAPVGRQYCKHGLAHGNVHQMEAAPRH